VTFVASIPGKFRKYRLSACKAQISYLLLRSGVFSKDKVFAKYTLTENLSPLFSCIDTYTSKKSSLVSHKREEARTKSSEKENIESLHQRRQCQKGNACQNKRYLLPFYVFGRVSHKLKKRNHTIMRTCRIFGKRSGGCTY